MRLCKPASRSPLLLSLLDVGRFVVRRNPNEPLQSSGQHPIREINPSSVTDPALLAAFCGPFE